MNRKKFVKALGSVSLVGMATSGFTKSYSKIKADACKTQRDAEGPYYKPDAPTRSVIEMQGTKLKIEGKVLKGDDCTTPVSNAVVDVWHCDSQGDYDLKGFKCRAQLKTDGLGNYNFTTIFPPPYGGRPRHIHFKIRAKGFPELTTQLYFHGDPNIQNDFARNAHKDRIISLVDETDQKKGIFNIYL